MATIWGIPAESHITMRPSLALLHQLYGQGACSLQDSGTWALPSISQSHIGVYCTRDNPCKLMVLSGMHKSLRGPHSLRGLGGIQSVLTFIWNSLGICARNRVQLGTARQAGLENQAYARQAGLCDRPEPVPPAWEAEESPPPFRPNSRGENTASHWDTPGKRKEGKGQYKRT